MLIHSHDVNIVRSQSLLISMEIIKYLKKWKWHCALCQWHIETETFIWCFCENEQHLSKNKAKFSQSDTNKSTILKVKGQGWF